MPVKKKVERDQLLSHKFLVIEGVFFCLYLIDIFVSRGMSTPNFIMYHGLKKIEFNKRQR